MPPDPKQTTTPPDTASNGRPLTQVRSFNFPSNLKGNLPGKTGIHNGMREADLLKVPVTGEHHRAFYDGKHIVVSFFKAGADPNRKPADVVMIPEAALASWRPVLP